MKIFVTGNSHSACLIEAWKQVQDSSPHQIDFFVRGGSGVKDYRIDGTRIEAGNDDFRGYLARLGLRDSFDLAEYDARRGGASGAVGATPGGRSAGSISRPIICGSPSAFLSVSTTKSQWMAAGVSPSAAFASA